MESSFAQRVVEMISEGVWILDHQSRTVSASRRLHTILGCPEGALADRTLASFLTSDNEAIAKEMLERCRSGSSVPPQQLRFVSDGGGEIDALVSMTRLDERILVTVADITERTQLQALFSLREGLQRAASFEELSNAAFDAMHATLAMPRASIQLLDAKGATTFVARRGLSDAYVQTIESRWRSTFDPSNPTTFVSNDMEQDAARESLWREVLAEGIRSLLSIPLVAQSRLLGKFVIYDSKPRRFSRAEIQLAETIANNVAFAIDRMQAEAALREGMSQLRLALRASKTGTWSRDFSTGLATWDERAHEVMGVEPGMYDGTAEEFLRRLHPDDRERLRRHGAGTGEFTEQFRVFASDGSIRHVAARGRVILGADGKPIGIAGVCADVTAEARREEEKARLLEKLQQTQKLESLGVLAGGIAHDFNNLLVGILGTVDLARHDLTPGSPLQEPLSYIETAAQRAANLAQQMLAYSGRGRVVVQPVDLSELVQEMAQLLGTVISKKAEMTLELARDLPPVKADPTQLRQIVMNLITNASDALDGRPGQVSLKTSLRSVDRATFSGAVVGEDLPEGEYAILEVSDSGCGMDRDTLTKIFEPFFTTKFTGRGLGLAAVLGIVRSHGGAILVDTSAGSGTTFTVVLPPAARASTTQAKQAAPVANPPAESATVLVVDDESLVRTTTERILLSAGFRVVSAVNGKDAIDRLTADPQGIDLVLLDMTMPLMNGDEVLRELRRIHPGLRAIISSGFSDVASESLPAQAHFIAKPYTANDLIAKVRAALEG